MRGFFELVENVTRLFDAPFWRKISLEEKLQSQDATVT